MMADQDPGVVHAASSLNNPNLIYIYVELSCYLFFRIHDSHDFLPLVVHGILELGCSSCFKEWMPPKRVVTVVVKTPTDRSCSSIHQDLNPTHMNSREIKFKKNACRQESPLLIHIHITYWVCFCMVYRRKHNCAYYCLQLLQTFYNSFTKWQTHFWKMEWQNNNNNNHPRPLFFVPCPQLPVVATTLV
jgi:hypothetical protein